MPNLLSGVASVQPSPELPAQPIRADDPALAQRLAPTTLTGEYVSSTTYGPQIFPLKNFRVGSRSLPPVIDDLQRSVRFDIYELMMLDGQVKACVGLLVAGIVGGGVDILPASPDNPTAAEIAVADFCRDSLDEHLESSFRYDFLPDMLKAVAVGHRLAEKVYYPLDQSPIPGKWVLRNLKPKHRRWTSFVVDYFMNVIGIANTPYGVLTGSTYDVIERSKFAVLTWKPTDGDPRGNSDLRSVYEPWWRKQRYRPQHIRFLDQFAAPSLIMELSGEGGLRQRIDPVTGVPMLDPQTGQPVYVDRAKEGLAALEQFQNSSLLVVPNGSKVTPIEVTGDGRAFVIALEMDNLEIAKSILYSTLATESSGSGGSNRSAASIHQDVLSTNISYGIGIVEDMIRRDVLTQLVYLNFPPGTRVPRVRLPGANRQDFLAWASAISKLSMASYLDPSQYPEVDAMLGLPRRSSEGQQSLVDMVRAQRKNAELEKPKPMAAGGTGSEDGAQE